MFLRCAQQVLLAAWLVSYSVLFGNDKQTVLKREDEHKPLVLDFMKNRDCLWNTEFKHCRKNTYRANALQKTVQEFNCLELAVQDVKLKIKTIRIMSAAKVV
jgi:hypothetical protein